MSRHIDVSEMVDELREQGVSARKLEGITTSQVAELKGASRNSLSSAKIAWQSDVGVG